MRVMPEHMTRQEDLVKRIVGILDSTMMTKEDVVELFENVLGEMSENKLDDILFDIQSNINQATI
jgi:hypothetical protein